MAPPLWNKGGVQYGSPQRTVFDVMREVREKEAAMAGKPEPKKVTKTEFVAAGAIYRMQQRQLSMAWESWQEWYTELKAQQYRLAGAIRRMMNRQISMAWERWQQWYAEMVEQRRKLDQALRRMMNRKLSMAWERWQQWYAEVMADQPAEVIPPKTNPNPNPNHKP